MPLRRVDQERVAQVHRAGSTGRQHLAAKRGAGEVVGGELTQRQSRLAEGLELAGDVEVRADLVDVTYKCSCPSRKLPCKHGIALLLIQGIFMAFYSRDQVGRLLVVGVVTMFFAHTFQNAGMNLGMLPVIGLPMPFISYGGTFMIVTLFLVGMMQSVWVHRNICPVRRKTVGGRELRDEEED